MDVTSLLLRASAARPRVLLVTAPGGTAVRLAAEKELRSRDWPLAATPAGADLMFVAGPDLRFLRAALGRLWHDLPQPRVRVQAVTAGEVSSALDAGRARLGAPGRRRAGQRWAAGEDGPPQSGPSGGPHTEKGQRAGADDSAPGGSGGHRDNGSGRGGHGAAHGRSPGGHPGHDDRAGRRHASEEPEQGDDARHARGGHGDHGDEDMEMPGGLPMAERGEDRDGLTLDRLHVPLGPFLLDWPAGLTIRVVLQGDVVQQADLGELPADGPKDVFWSQPWIRARAGEPVGVGEAARRRAAGHLDSLGRLLSVAGWPAEAVTARRLRDDLLAEAPGSAVLPRLERFARRVGRSRTLYWLTRGIGSLSAAEARAAGVSGPAARADGDVPARYRQWLAEVIHDVRQLDEPALLDPAAHQAPRGRWDTDRPPSLALTELLPRLLVGAELSAARLIVASLDPDPDELAAAHPAEVARG